MQVGQGLYLGYRRSANSDLGTWVARWRDPTGKQHHHALGVHDDVNEPRRLCLEWHKKISANGMQDINTVNDAVDHYLGELRAQGRNQTALAQEGILQRTVLSHPIATRRIDQLTPIHLRHWRDGLTGKASTRRRYQSALMAVLNLAYREGAILSDLAWRNLKPIRDSEATSRDRWLTADERQRLLEFCHPVFEPFCRGLMLTGFRPSELANAKVKDFDRKAGTIHVDGKTGERTVPVSAACHALMIEACRDKLPQAPIFSDADGNAWVRKTWAAEMIHARKLAGLDDEVVAYALRHTFISEAIQNGVDVFTVAKLVGTSIQMIQKHYGHLCSARTREQLDGIYLV